MLAVVPIMVLGLMAGACLVSSAEWKGENPVVMALGAGEEVAAAHAIVTASKIDPDAVTAQNPAVDASIMKEVEKAEKEQARPSVFLPAVPRDTFTVRTFAALKRGHIYPHALSVLFYALVAGECPRPFWLRSRMWHARRGLRDARGRRDGRSGSG
jgi:hypothetical protein